MMRQASIALCTYNGARFVEYQFARQSLLPGELIVCDDQSTDETAALVIAYETAGNISSDDEAGLRALGMILQKHHDMFQEKPRALCNHLCLLGHTKCLQGKMAAGRKDLLNALKAWPLRGKAWVALFASFFGARAYELTVSWKKRA